MEIRRRSLGFCVAVVLCDGAEQGGFGRDVTGRIRMRCDGVDSDTTRWGGAKRERGW